MKLFKHFITAGLASLCVCGLAIAGDKDSKSKPDQPSQKQSDQGDSQSSKGPNYQVSPSGWIRMAVDYDSDGSFDAIETIYTFDLEKARKSSRDRANRDAQKTASNQRSKGDRQNNSGQRSQDERMASNQQQETVSGKILQLDSETLSGMDEPCMIARIRTDKNWPAKVVLGPKSKLKSLQLAEGDEVTVSGRKGRVNDKTMLLASAVQSDGKEVAVEMPSSRNAKRVRADLLSMRATEFQNHEGQFVIAQIQCPNGKKSTVNLGAKSKVDRLNLNEGDELRLIVRPAKINGMSGMVADEVMANGKSVNVSPPNRIAKKNRKGVSNDRDPSDQADRRTSARDSNSRESDANQSSSNQAALGIAIDETGEGVVILGIHPKSPAAETDLQVGDAIVSINGESVDSPYGLVRTISEMQPSDDIQVKLRREGEEQTVQVRLTSRSKLMANLR